MKMTYAAALAAILGAMGGCSAAPVEEQAPVVRRSDPAVAELLGGMLIFSSIPGRPGEVYWIVGGRKLGWGHWVGTGTRAVPAPAQILARVGVSQAAASEAAAAALGETAGGGVLATGAVVTVILVAAVGGAVLIDCQYHGNCVWTAVNEAGGFNEVLNPLSPSVTSIPNLSGTNVACAEPDKLLACRRALANVPTQYSYWGVMNDTCGDMWSRGEGPMGSATDAWNTWITECNAKAAQCVAQTERNCEAMGVGGAIGGPFGRLQAVDVASRVLLEPLGAEVDAPREEAEPAANGEPTPDGELEGFGDF